MRECMFYSLRLASRPRGLTAVILTALWILAVTCSVRIEDAYAGKRSKKSGRAVVHKSFELKGFDAIRVDGIADIDVTIGPEFSVELKADESLVDRVEVFVRKKTLVIDLEDDRDFDSDEEIHFDITMPELNEVVVNGVARIKAAVLTNEYLEISCPGVGEMVFEGKTEKLDISVKGVGELDFGDLVSDDARVTLNGVGDVTVHARKRLDARVHGMGSIRYRGDPAELRTQVNGLGRIKRKN